MYQVIFLKWFKDVLNNSNNKTRNFLIAVILLLATYLLIVLLTENDNSFSILNKKMYLKDELKIRCYYEDIENNIFVW